ncbi:ABC transporter permease [Pseudonocardia alni]|uniref:ABC transporter permease n=1 Tax=Pseudonocardia alni TaxID=33907 RepID=UPI001AD6F37B|nr:ABC transporter permease [Pseudonocardia alni]MBO4240288.1 ABC transporter permease subunit [Pseudonocardia alni]
MGPVVAELIKIRRSLAWVVVVALPLLAVLTGTVTTVASGRPLEDGWPTLWLRTVVFHGLLPQTVALSVLASLVWRVEHRPGNRNALRCSGVGSRATVVGKLTVLALLAAAMQLVLVGATVACGTLVFGLPGPPPARFALVSAVVVVACLPVLAVQSALSMLWPSFAAPVAAATAGAVVGVGLLLTGVAPLVAAVPHALLGRATQLGTGVFADDGTIGTGTVLGIAGAALVATALLVEVSAWLLDRR